MRPSTPRFSVVIPLYNKADTIDRALRSVRSQTNSDFDLVVVNDGSTDRSAEIVERFEGIEQLRLIQQKNAGVSAARNRGARESCGEYIVFLDADDYWQNNFLQVMSKAVDDFSRPVMVGTGFHWVTKDGHWMTRNTGRIERVDLIKETAVFQPVHTSSMAVRRDAFELIGGFDTRHGYYEDLEFLFKLALRFPNDMVVARWPLAYHMDDAAFSITKTWPVRDVKYPHLEALKECSLLIKPYVRHMVIFNSLRFCPQMNRMLKEQNPSLPIGQGWDAIFLSLQWRGAAAILAFVFVVIHWIRLQFRIVKI